MTRVFRPGVFDLFHVGHLACIVDAAKRGEYLIIGVQDDRDVEACKGKQPVIPLSSRMEILRAIRFVDEVISYRDSNLSKLLGAMRIDVLAVGEDYGETEGQRDTLKYCEQNKIEVHRTPRTSGISSSMIRESMRFWDSRPIDKNPAATMLTSGSGDEQWAKEQTRKELQIFADFIRPTDRVLDLGCGNGRLSIELSKKCKEMVCVDSSPSMVKYLRLSARDNITVVQCDVASFEASEKFDVVIASGIFPCLDDFQFNRLCKNMAGLVREDGLLLVRASVANKKRIDVINQYSPDLNDLYTAYYRTFDEINQCLGCQFERLHGAWRLYSNHTDTTVVFSVHIRTGKP